MDAEVAFPEEAEPEHTAGKEAAAEEMVRLGDSEDEEDVREDGALSSDDEEFVIGKKKPISKGRPRGKKIHHAGTFPDVQPHVPVHVRDNLFLLIFVHT